MNPAEKDKSERSEATRLYEMSSEKNRNLLLFYLVVIAYILIIVLSTTDLNLLLPERAITLPVFSVGIPLLYFYALSPPLVLILHFNLIHNTIEHLKKIERWKGNRKTIPSYRLHPYIFDFAYLSPPGWWGMLLVLSRNLLFFFLAPVCLLCIQLRFSDFQSFWSSLWHFICLFADLCLLIFFFIIEHKLKNKGSKKQDREGVKAFWGLFFVELLFVGFIFLVLFLEEILVTWFLIAVLLITWFFIPWFLIADFPKDIVELPKEKRQSFSAIFFIFAFGLANLSIVGMFHCKKTIAWLEKPSELILPGFIQSRIIPKITIPPRTRIQKQSIEELQLIAAQTGTDGATVWEIHGENYDLSNRRLVFSDLSGSNMQKIVLEKAYLQGTNMAGAQMQGARMRGAQMQGADMQQAQMQGADMRGAQMQDANMQSAQMQGADMQQAQMQGADMWSAQMQGADMWSAQMQGADMRSAQMQGADMTDAQMQGANMTEAQMQGANMQRAQMQGANMRRAQMQGANMRSAQMQGANMRRAQMQGADMTDAQMQGASMRGAQMQGANMRKANLRGSFCDEEKYNSFFDRINARIGKKVLEECDVVGEGQFGALTQDTANRNIIRDLRKKSDIPEKIISDVHERINKRDGKVADMAEVKTKALDLKEACEIIANWQKDVENAPKVKDTFADWLDTEAGQNSELQKCPTASKVRTPSIFRIN